MGSQPRPAQPRPQQSQSRPAQRQPQQTQSRPVQQQGNFAPANTKPYVKCPSAMKCVERRFCDFNGVMTNDELILTRDLEMLRVPLIDCVNRERGNSVDVCCRDPNYKDPWPNMNGQNGGNNGGNGNNRGNNNNGFNGNNNNGFGSNGNNGISGSSSNQGNNIQFPGNQAQPRKNKKKHGGYGR